MTSSPSKAVIDEDKVDGTQYTENILNPEISVVDPLAQTFRVGKF